MPRVSLDPRARVLLLVLSLAPPLLFNDPRGTGACALLYLAVGAATGAGPALRSAGLVLLPLVPTSMALWALLLGQGEVVARVGPFALRDVSLLFGLAMGLRFTAWTVAGVAFVALTPVEELAWALHRLGLPYPVAFGLSTSLRLARQLRETAISVAEAQQSRGLDLTSGSLGERVRKAAPMLIPLLVLSLRRVNSMAMAMEARGYGAGRRTSWICWRWSAADTGAVLAAAVGVALCAWLRWQGFLVLVPDRL